MYNPSAFSETRIEVMHELMRSHPLALLVSGTTAGLSATPLPFQIYPDAGANGTLRAHLAKANPHWRELQSAAECLVVFQGPHGYITPSWYPSKQATHRVVPTWNYVMVQAWGKPRIVDDVVWLRRLVEDLTASQERGRSQPWAISDAPESFIAAQLQAIIGIEIPITRIEGKWKLSQNRLAADRAGVVAGLGAAGDPHFNAALAGLVAERHHASKDRP